MISGGEIGAIPKGPFEMAGGVLLNSVGPGIRLEVSRSFVQADPLELRVGIGYSSSLVSEDNVRKTVDAGEFSLSARRYFSVGGARGFLGATGRLGFASVERVKSSSSDLVEVPSGLMSDESFLPPCVYREESCPPGEEAPPEPHITDLRLNAGIVMPLDEAVGAASFLLMVGMGEQCLRRNNSEASTCYSMFETLMAVKF